MAGQLKVAEFTVWADARQSARWKQMAAAEGAPSVGRWLAAAADSYLKMRATEGLPVALAWGRGPFPVVLNGKRYQVSGHTSPPFGVYRGTLARPIGYKGGRSFVLIYLPTSRVLATLWSFREAKTLASELARIWVRYEGDGEPQGRPADDAVRAFR